MRIVTSVSIPVEILPAFERYTADKNGRGIGSSLLAAAVHELIRAGYILRTPDGLRPADKKEGKR